MQTPNRERGAQGAQENRENWVRFGAAWCLACGARGVRRVFCSAGDSPETRLECPLRHYFCHQQIARTLSNGPSCRQTTGAMTFTLNINGKPVRADVDADTPLLWVLRDSLDLVGTKFGCGGGFCGACTVHVDGR